MKWVTLKRVKLDRTVSAWLIMRRLDPDAEFEFVERDEMQAAIEGGARPFHNYVFAGTPREKSGFQELLAENDLEGDQALVLLGQTVRRAERSGWSKNGCQDEGLWAIANGVTTISRDDAEVIERLLPVYDALFAYCQQRAEGGTGWTSDR